MFATSSLLCLAVVVITSRLLLFILSFLGYDGGSSVRISSSLTVAPAVTSSLLAILVTSEIILSRFIFSLVPSSVPDYHSSLCLPPPRPHPQTNLVSVWRGTTTRATTDYAPDVTATAAALSTMRVFMKQKMDIKSKITHLRGKICKQLMGPFCS